MESALRWIGYGLCHQLPERSFFGGGVQLPVCARDTGIYVGFALAVLVLVALSRGRRPTEIPPVWASAVLGGFLLIMVADGLTSYAGFRETDNDIRLLTGLLAGYAIAALAMPLVNGQLWRRSGSERVLASARDFAAYLLSIAVAFLLLRWAGPMLGVVFPLLSALAILVTFTTVNLIMVCLFPPLERKAEGLRDAWPQVLAALGLTLFELWASGLVRLWLDRLAGVLG